MTAATRYPRALLDRAWARSAALRMAPPPPVAPAPPIAPVPDPPAGDAAAENDADFDDEPAFDPEVLEEARRDPLAFNALVLRDANGNGIKNAAHHAAFHEKLSDPNNPRLALLAFAESGKTTSITIGRVLWELGHNPNLRIGVLGDTTAKAAEIVEVVSRLIRESEELHAVFPQLRQARKDADPLRKLKGRVVRWTMAAFTVERSSRVRDPSVRATGYGKPVQGARFDLLIIDDLVTYDTSRTERQRVKLSRWFKNAIAGRLTHASRVWFLNTAYHPRDIIHEFANRSGAKDGLGYKIFSFPLRDPITGKSNWPEHYPDLDQRIYDLGGEGSVEVARQVDALPKDESAEQFKDAWINRCTTLGAGVAPIDRWVPTPELPSDCFLITGIDIGLGKKETNAETVLFTILVYPSGWDEWGYSVQTYQVLWIEAGRWTGPEILDRVYDSHERFGSLVYIESNAAQIWLTQFTLPPKNGKARPPPPILPFQTNANKWNPSFGVASIGIDFQQGRWIIPADDEGRVVNPEIAKWLGEVRSFAPDAHTGDRLMAAWIAREGARRHVTGTGGIVQVFGS